VPWSGGEHVASPAKNSVSSTGRAESRAARIPPARADDHDGSLRSRWLRSWLRSRGRALSGRGLHGMSVSRGPRTRRAASRAARPALRSPRREQLAHRLGHFTGLGYSVRIGCRPDRRRVPLPLSKAGTP
jgi:hypothetical protein